MNRTVETVPDSQIIAKPPAKVGTSDQKKRMNLTARMKQKFDNEPTEKVRIREEDGSQFVQVNGYSYRIFPSEDYVEVPRTVAAILRERKVI